MKCRAKRCLQWRASTARSLTAGGLQSKWRPQILYLVGVSSHPLVWLFIMGARRCNNSIAHLLLFEPRKNLAVLARLREMVYICTAKPIKNKTMKAYLYKEEAQPIDPIDEQQLAIAEEKPEKPDVPKLSLYVVKYKPLWTATLIALVIFIIWAIATWLLN